MTKHLTGKKTQEIKFALLDNKLYITNGEYYIIIDQNNEILKWKNNQIDKFLNIIYSQNTNTVSQIYKKEITDTLSKTLFRSCGDTVNQSRYQYNTLYTDDEGKIKCWINHKKN